MRDPGVRVPSTGKPSHIMVGFDRPGGGVRLYASRNVDDTGWASRNTGKAANVWHLDADMDHVLIIDKPTWGEAYARAFEIWENHDRNAAIEAKEAERRVKAIQARCTPDEPSDFVRAVQAKVVKGELTE